MGIIFLIIFTSISAIYSASETALFSISSLTLKSYKTDTNKRKRLIFQLLQQPLDLLITILMINVLVNILVQNIASNIFGLDSSWLLTVGVPLVLTLIFGEVIPKTLALSNNKRIAYRIAPLISLSRGLLSPLRFFLKHITSYICGVFFFFLKREGNITKEELKDILKSSEKRGVIEKYESSLMHGYMDLQDTLVKEIMRPREEIIFFDINDNLEDLTSLFVDKEVSHIPVCENEVDNILGIITAQIYFMHKEELKNSKDLTQHLVKPYFIPETMPGFNLLRHLNAKEEPLTIVVNEYGSISGLLTKEDLIEVIVGEISDRIDEKVRYTISDKNTIIASGKLELSEFETIFNEPLVSSSNMVTVGGWLIEQLGSIPKSGSKYTTDNFLFNVLQADPNRIKRIYIRKLKKGD